MTIKTVINQFLDNILVNEVEYKYLLDHSIINSETETECENQDISKIC